MKLLSLVVICIICIISNGSVMAQTRCYDPYTLGAKYEYNPAPGYDRIGDILSAPCHNVASIEMGFVALAPGTYNIGFHIWSNYCLGAPPGTPIPITIPTGGTFPSSWRITYTPSSPIVSIQYFSLISASRQFWPAFTINKPGIAKGIDGISVDLNPTNGALSPSLPGCFGFEWYTANDQTNLLFAMITTPSPFVALHGPFVKEGYTIQVERDSAPVRLVSTMSEIKPDQH